MQARFTSFVVFAEMRTGSNFLEVNLNALAGVQCFGEAFNPHFLGYPDSKPILGVDLATRDRDPGALLMAIREAPQTLGGFRYFHDHDPRVLDAILADETCAKIILTRNPAESYVSWKIARETGQWKLTDLKARKAAEAHFDPAEFEAHLEAMQAFQVMLLNRLQITGQTAFYLAYEDLQNLDVMNGLAAFLGVSARLDALDKSLKKQNPSSIASKVRNFSAMQDGLARLDRFNLTRTPSFEPRRGPVVPSYIAAARAPLLYLPLRSGPVAQVTGWLAALDGVEEDALLSGMTQKALRQWKRAAQGHRSFTVLRHPVARAHDAFCRHILSTGEGSYGQLRQTLVRRFDLPLPEDGPGADYDQAAHAAAFAAFLRFLKANLAGQTAVRVDAAWCTQVEAIRGFGEFCLPDHIFREDELAESLPDLARAAGYATPPSVPKPLPDQPFALSDIYDARIEKLAAEAYQRDYMMFGFGAYAA